MIQQLKNFFKDNSLDAQIENRRKQAKKLGIKEAVKTVAVRHEDQKKDIDKHESMTIARYKDLKLTYTNDRGIAPRRNVYEIKYDGERVYYQCGAEITTFKPCGWIDTLLKEHRCIEKEREQERKSAREEKYGLNRECDSKIFNKIFNQ